MRRVNSYDPDAPTPAIGSRWVWEPVLIGETITVLAVEWNGEEWWVRTRADGTRMWLAGRVLGALPGRPCWNSLSRFWEAVRPITPGGPS